MIALTTSSLQIRYNMFDSIFRTLLFFELLSIIREAFFLPWDGLLWEIYAPISEPPDFSNQFPWVQNSTFKFMIS